VKTERKAGLVNVAHVGNHAFATFPRVIDTADEVPLGE